MKHTQGTALNIWTTPYQRKAGERFITGLAITGLVGGLAAFLGLWFYVIRI